MSDLERRLAVLALVARRLDGAANLARVAVHELTMADLPGAALDEALRALYEINRVSYTLRSQLEALRKENRDGDDAA